MTASSFAILISCLSLVISVIALGWNIYKDVYLRARVRTSFKLMVLQHATFQKPLWRFCFSAMNLGPGKVRLETLALQESSIWKKITRRTQRSVLIHEFDHPLGGTLPCDLDVGAGMNFTFDPARCDFLNDNDTHIGIRDSFGRIHWCGKHEMVAAKKDFREKRWAQSAGKRYGASY